MQTACEQNGYVMLVTADHGNAERMIDEEGKPVTKHTTYRGVVGREGEERGRGRSLMTTATLGG